jgi:hypothetical protein
MKYRFVSVSSRRQIWNCYSFIIIKINFCEMKLCKLLTCSQNKFYIDLASDSLRRNKRYFTCLRIIILNRCYNMSKSFGKRNLFSEVFRSHLRNALKQKYNKNLSQSWITQHSTVQTKQQINLHLLSFFMDIKMQKDIWADDISYNL